MVDHMILTSARQVWPPFVLVTGLLLIGAVAAADGLFEALGARLARARLSARSLLLALLGLVPWSSAGPRRRSDRRLPGRRLERLGS